MNYIGIMGAKSHHRNGRIRWRYGVGTWIALLAVFLNALATVVFAPITAQAGEDVAWVHICAPDGFRTIAVEQDGETDEKVPPGSHCPTCPFFPTHRDLDNIGPALTAEASRVAFIPQLFVTRYFLTSEPVGPAAPYSSFLSRGPPLHA